MNHQRRLYKPTNDINLFTQQVNEMLEEKKKSNKVSFKDCIALPGGNSGMLYVTSIMLALTILIQGYLLASNVIYFVIDFLVWLGCFIYLLGKNHEKYMISESHNNILHVVKDEEAYGELEEAVA